MATEGAKKQRHETVLTTIENAQSSPSWEERLAVVDVIDGLLGDLPSERTVERLIEDLDRLARDSKWEVRRAVVPVLLNASRPAVKSLIERLTRDDNQWVRQAAERAKRKLARITTPAEKQDKKARFAFEAIKDLDGTSAPRIYQAAIRVGEKYYEELAGDTAHELNTYRAAMEGLLGRDRLLNALAAELAILSATTPPAESNANRVSIALDSLRALDPDRFELLVAELLELSGFHNVVPFGGTGDEGIDIRAEWLEQLPTGDVLSRIWAVQCKRYSSPIGPKHIEGILNAALEPPKDLLPAPPDFFLLATSSSLTVNARRVVERANGNRHKYSCRFVVWDGEAILRRIEPHERLLSKFFSPAIATPQSPRPEQVSMLRLSILIDSVEDDFVISFLCESESSSPICQRAQTKILRADFDALVDKCRSLSARPLVDRTKEDLLKQVGGAIQCLIPSSIQVTLRDHGECYIRIASNMHVVPFELAWDSATDEFLGSAKRVGRIQVADAPIRPLRVPAPSVLLIGAAEHSRFPSLPGSAEELRETSALFSSWGISVTQLVGSSVSLTKIRAALDQQNFQVVHFSGHGVANAPGGSGLVFSEGIVSFADIGRSDFGGALVFLSACSSGSALDEAARSYFQAGAIGLIGFVGPVTDKGAALIAVNF